MIGSTLKYESTICIESSKEVAMTFESGTLVSNKFMPFDKQPSLESFYISYFPVYHFFPSSLDSIWLMEIYFICIHKTKMLTK